MISKEIKSRLRPKEAKIRKDEVDKLFKQIIEAFPQFNCKKSHSEWIFLKRKDWSIFKKKVLEKQRNKP